MLETDQARMVGVVLVLRAVYGGGGVNFDCLSKAPPTDRAWGVNFGGGLNSTALILGCGERAMRPDWITFADTGAEKPETMRHLERMQRWCAAAGFPEIAIVQWERAEPLPDGTRIETLEANCLRTGYLPSVAYGHGGCSSKWKHLPLGKWRREHGWTSTVIAIGYDAGEERRVNRAACSVRVDNAGESVWYPLVAWGYHRQDCQDVCHRHGFSNVPKSSCFFCPHMKPHEWRALATCHPDLLARALAIEDGARASGNADTAGLMRSRHLREWLALDAAQQTLFDDAPHCDCTDEGDDEVAA